MQSKAKKLSLSGILLALTVLTLFAESVVPTNKLSLYILSSFFISIVISEFGLKTGWTFYFSSCILAFIIIQDKAALVPYVLFFGVYGIVKLYIERLNRLVPEYLIKLLFANAVLVLIYTIFKQLVPINIKVNFPWWILIVMAQFIFLLYDYVYSLFIQYYHNKVRKILKL